MSDHILAFSYAFNTSAISFQYCLHFAMPDFPPGPLKSPNRTSSLPNTADINAVSSSADHFVRAFYSLMSTPSFAQIILSVFYSAMSIYIRQAQSRRYQFQFVLYFEKVPLIEWTFLGEMILWIIMRFIRNTVLTYRYINPSIDVSYRKYKQLGAAITENFQKGRLCTLKNWISSSKIGVHTDYSRKYTVEIFYNLKIWPRTARSFKFDIELGMEPEQAFITS